MHREGLNRSILKRSLTHHWLVITWMQKNPEASQNNQHMQKEELDRDRDKALCDCSKQISHYVICHRMKQLRLSFYKDLCSIYQNIQVKGIILVT
jgi:hypothetical protein